ncbi:MAG: copper-binding protein [Thiobacillaceae bacterium]
MPYTLPLLLTLFTALPAWADRGHQHHGDMAQTATAASPAEGEVRRVDLAQGRLTLRHGPIESLGMPPMTMVFRVQDLGLLDGLKPGDRVRFEARRRDGVYTVVWLEKQP